VVGVAGAATSSGQAFERTLFARGFDDPLLLTHAPGEPATVYVVEQPGRVIRVRSGRRTVFLDVRDQIEVSREEGLLGLAFHPRYARNRLFYVAYTSDDDENVVARYRSNGARAIPSSRKILLAVDDPYSNHNGGHLAFGPDGRLYTAIGDGGSSGDPEDRSQNMRSLHGKLLALDVSKPNARWRIDALGLRNPWRFSFDRANGDLYIGDVGWRDFEEVDYRPRSSPGLENYGWDVFEGTLRKRDEGLGPGRLVRPVFEYDHDTGCSITGGYVYRGRARPAERGRYVFGDYCEGTIWSFQIAGGRAEDVRTEPFRIESLTSFGENAAGELFATSQDGTIYRLS
jgi:glucose/arabinose dehydrogenase